jgi:hypothetical protein
MNGLFGQLPREIGSMTKLKELHLFGNYLQGSIPTELAKLHKLGTWKSVSSVAMNSFIHPNFNAFTLR